MTHELVRAVLTTFAVELNKLGVKCKLKHDDYYLGGCFLTIGRYNVIYDIELKKLMLLYPSDDYQELPVDVADPNCYVKFATFLARDYKNGYKSGVG